MALTKADFDRYHRENPKVWLLFERFTLAAVNAGNRHVGAKAVWERMRWEAEVETPGDDFAKLNNNYTSFYVRMWNEKYPMFDKVFATRESVADARREEPIMDRKGQTYLPGVAG